MTNSPKILIVDDEIDIIRTYGEKFSKNGFNVVTSLKGEETVNLAKEELPDIILLDVLMPGLDGFKILKTLKNDPQTKQIPIIMLTNVGEVDGIEKGIILGADDYLVKVNFTPGEVVEKVRKFLAKRKE